MTLITKNFPVCCAVSKTSTSTEERKREQEPEGLALNLDHIMGATPRNGEVASALPGLRSRSSTTIDQPMQKGTVPAATLRTGSG